MLSEQAKQVPRKERASKKAVVLGGSLLFAACLSGAALMYGSNETTNESEAFLPREGRSHGFLGYYFENTPMTWNEGKAFCEARGMVLATVDSKWKLDDARTASGNQEVWIGLRSLRDQQSNKNAWRWQSGSPTGFGDWAPWGAHEPNQLDGEFCTEMRPNGEWNNLPCNNPGWKRRVLCDKSPYVGTYVVHGLPYGVTWDNADLKCRRRYGTSLATVSSLASSKLAMQLVPTDQAHSSWVGIRQDPLQDWHAQGFGYVSGQPVSVALRWLPNEPNNAGAGENCVEMVRDGRLNDLACTARRNYYICDKAVLNELYSVSMVERLADFNPRREYAVPGKLLEYRGRTSAAFTMEMRVRSIVGGWGSIFHVGNENMQRNPALWTFPGSKRLHIRQSSVGNNNRGCDPDESKYPAMGQWFDVLILSTPGQFQVKVRDVVSCTDTVTIAPPSDAQTVYMSDPWHAAAEVTVRDLHFIIE